MEILIIIPILFIVLGITIAGVYVGDILQNFLESKDIPFGEIMPLTMIITFLIMGAAIAIETIRFLNIYP